MLNTEKAFEKLRDKVVTEQFLACCTKKPAFCVKKRMFGSLDEYADAAEQFLEALALRNMGK